MDMPTRRPSPTTYILTDATGAEVARHVRVDLPEGGKRFEWWRNGEPNLGGLPTKDLPLYRLPDLLAAPESQQWVILVEGEKTADALAEHGFLVVATACGANVTPTEEVLRPLVGRLVYVWPDNDGPGRKLMEAIAACLHQLGVTVLVVDWPEAPAKGDAADLFDQGGTAADVDALLTCAREWQPAAPEVLPTLFAPSDLGNARRLVALHGADLRYSHPEHAWWVWNGQRWERDQTGEVDRRAKGTVEQIGAEAAKLRDDEARKAMLKHALSSESEAKRKALIASAQSEPGIPILPSAFDSNPLLLNCTSGLVDLRTLSLLPHYREGYCTKLAPVEYDPEATCPTWLAFLERVTGGDRQLQDFLQRAVGYSLTGDTSEQCLFLCYGTGANGKTTFLEALQALLGDYARKADFSTFLQRRGDSGPRNDLAALAGARFVVATEADAGKRLAEALVKELTGGDQVTARFLYGEHFTFRPQFKLWLAANHKPRITGTDYAIWRRIRLIPFAVTIPKEEQDPRLPAKLRAELPGIFAWAMEGCAAWRQFGLGDCEAVTQATAAYREESDTLAEFLGNECLQGASAKVSSRDLYGAYTRWCEANGERTLARKAFGQQLEERGLWSLRGTGGTRWWGGVGLLTEQRVTQGTREHHFP